MHRTCRQFGCEVIIANRTDDHGMNRDVYWTPATRVGLGSLHLVEDSAGVDVESIVVGSADSESFHIRYEIECDRHYRARRVEVSTLG